MPPKICHARPTVTGAVCSRTVAISSHAIGSAWRCRILQSAIDRLKSHRPVAFSRSAKVAKCNTGAAKVKRSCAREFSNSPTIPDPVFGPYGIGTYDGGLRACVTAHSSIKSRRFFQPTSAWLGDIATLPPHRSCRIRCGEMRSPKSGIAAVKREWPLRHQGWAAVPLSVTRNVLVEIGRRSPVARSNRPRRRW